METIRARGIGLPVLVMQATAGSKRALQNVGIEALLDTKEGLELDPSAMSQASRTPFWLQSSSQLSGILSIGSGVLEREFPAALERAANVAYVHDICHRVGS